MKTNRITLVLCAIASCLAFGCAGTDQEHPLPGSTPLAVDPNSIDITHPVYEDDGTFCRDGDENRCEAARLCAAGDKVTCNMFGFRDAQDDGVQMEPDDFYTNADPEEDIPTLGAVDTGGGDIGKTRQAFLSTQLFGWRLATANAPGFMDLVGGQGLPPRNRCGTQTGHTCIFPVGPDIRSTWKWRWERGFAGDGGVSCGTLNGNDDFLIGLRRAASAWSQNTGITLTEVNSGEDITIFCDGAAVDRLDPNHVMHAASYPFGNTLGPQANVIHAETAACVADGSIPTVGLVPGAAYLYQGAGILLAPERITGNVGSDRWSACANFNINPNAIVNLGERIGAHEFAHVFGFGHFQTLPWFKRRVDCDEVVNAASGTLSIPSSMKATLLNFVSKKRQESINFPSTTGFQVDRQLDCLKPDVLNGSGQNTEGTHVN